MSNVECAWPVEAVLGEGPVWSSVDRALWFVGLAHIKVMYEHCERLTVPQHIRHLTIVARENFHS